MTKKILAGLLLLLGSGYITALAQQALPKNEDAIQLLYEGKQALNQKRYSHALSLFEQAANFPFNRSTTTAIYLAGIASMYQGNTDKAQRYFHHLIQAYPRSRYVEEARYHRALMLLRSDWEDRRRAGLSELIYLIDNAYSISIVRDALDAVRHYLFYQASTSYLERLYEVLADHHRLMLAEALCYRKVVSGEKEQAELFYEQYLREEGEDSPFLQQLFQHNTLTPTHAAPGKVHIAIALPLYLDDYLIKYAEDIPQKTKPWLEFYEGFQMGVEQYSRGAAKEYYLRVIDTRRDSATIVQNLYQLDAFRPDIVVGDIFNQSSAYISEWAESRGVPQIVPMSPTFEVKHKSHTFLAHPSLETRATRMAEFARDVLQLKTVAVWSDQKRHSETFARAFAATFDTLGGEVLWVRVDSIYDRGPDEGGAKYEIPDSLFRLRLQQVEGMYVPIGNEAICGLILSQLAALDWNVKVMGTSHWKSYKRIDRELKEKYGLIFTSSSSYNPALAAYREFYTQYLKEYDYPPSDFCLQGFDLGMYIAKVMDLYDYSWGMPLSAYIRTQSYYEGIHIHYYWGGSQSNQFVNINEYHPAGIRKLNTSNWQQWQLDRSWKRMDTDNLQWDWGEFVDEGKKRN